MSINTDRILISPPFEADVAAAQGGIDAWYGMACANMMAMLSDRGLQVDEIRSPEQFKGEAFARSHGFDAGAHVHLMFRSADAIRPIPGHYNVACFGWAFEVLRENGRPQDLVLDNQVRMLLLCDEVWVPSTFSRAVLAEHGIQAHVLPAPVSSSEDPLDKAEAFRRLAFTESVGLVSFSAGSEQEYAEVVEKRQRSLSRQHAFTRRRKPGGRVFLTVCDPSDASKNFANLVEGFLIATQAREDAVLVVRLLGTGSPGAAEARRAGLQDQDVSLTLAESLFRQVRPAFGHPHCLSEDRVIFVSDASLGDEAAALYGMADFYLSASVAEVQNIPMLEAMAQGCVPIALQSTGTADYVTPDNGVIVSHRPYAGVVLGLAADMANKVYAVDHADRYQIAQAVGSALALSAGEYVAKQQAARELVRSHYAPEVIYERFLRRLRLIDPALTAESLTKGAGARAGSEPGSPARRRLAAR